MRAYRCKSKFITPAQKQNNTKKRKRKEKEGGASKWGNKGKPSSKAPGGTAGKLVKQTPRETKPTAEQIRRSTNHTHQPALCKRHEETHARNKPRRKRKKG